MSPEAYFTICIVALTISLLFFTRYAVDFVFMAGLSILVISGILPANEALIGFSNEGMLTVGVLYIVAAGLKETGALQWLVQSLLGSPKNFFRAQLRIMLPVAFFSAFLNNTPVVAMLIPAVSDWCKRLRLSPSKLMLPLSYAAILGGTCTLIGTSTNLVINGLLINQTGQGLRVFEIFWIGLPIALLGIGFITLFSRWLLPERIPVAEKLRDPREYTIEMLVDANGPLVGKSIEKAGLRHLPNVFLADIERANRLLTAVSPKEVLVANDRLLFVGVVESLVDLHKMRGLIPASEQVFKLNVPRPERTLIEAVVSDSCPAVGRTVSAARFRSVYNAVVIAVARNGERIGKKIGDIILQAGDTLLLEAPPAFAEQYRNSRDFLLIHQLDDANPLRHDKAILAISILGLMVILAAFGVLSMFAAALLAAGLMISTGCVTGRLARRTIDWQVLIVIAASFGLGSALETTGAAQVIAQSLIGLAGGSPWFSLVLIYLITTVFTAVITNNSAAVLIFPICLATAENLDVNLMPFIITLMMAASASFATPISYQTNLMVYGPGGYHFSDYLRMGLPLNLVLGLLTVFLIPFIWNF